MEILLGKHGRAYENGYRAVREQGLLIVGLSPGNSYFSPGTIDDLLQTVSALGKTRIMIPYEPAVHSYKAIGYSAQAAENKARLQCNRLRNASKRSIENVLARDPSNDIRIIDWEEEIAANERFRKEYLRLQSFYKADMSFREDVQASTRDVLKNKIKTGASLDAAIEEGVHYLLKELAFLLESPAIFEAKSVAYVYHREWPIFTDMIEGKYGEPRDNLGFLILAAREKRNSKE